MTKPEALKKVLQAFERYYNINTDTPAAPFAAEAEFYQHDERYFLTRMARLGEMENREYVFFALEDSLDEDRLKELAEQAWKEGTSLMVIGEGHRCSDVILIILTDALSEAAKKAVPGFRYSRTYRFGLWGWSNFKLVAIELPAGKTVHNRHGSDLAKLFGNIFL